MSGCCPEPRCHGQHGNPHPRAHLPQVREGAPHFLISAPGPPQPLPPPPPPTLLGGSPSPTLESRYRCSSIWSSVFCCSRALFSASSLARCVRTRLWAEKSVRPRPQLPPSSTEDPYVSVLARGGRGPQKPCPPEQPSCLRNELGSWEQNQKSRARGPVTSTAQPHQEFPKEVSKSSWTGRWQVWTLRAGCLPSTCPARPSWGVTHPHTHTHSLTHWYFSKAMYRPSQRFCVA